MSCPFDKQFRKFLSNGQKDDFSVADEISLVLLFQSVLFVGDAEFLLRLEGDATRSEFDSQCFPDADRDSRKPGPNTL